MNNGSYVSQLVLWYKEQPFRDFPGGAVFATSLSNAGGVGSIPGWKLGSHMPQGQKTKI